MNGKIKLTIFMHESFNRAHNWLIKIKVFIKRRPKIILTVAILTSFFIEPLFPFFLIVSGIAIIRYVYKYPRQSLGITFAAIFPATFYRWLFIEQPGALGWPLLFYRLPNETQFSHIKLSFSDSVESFAVDVIYHAVLFGLAWNGIVWAYKLLKRIIAEVKFSKIEYVMLPFVSLVVAAGFPRGILGNYTRYSYDSWGFPFEYKSIHKDLVGIGGGEFVLWKLIVNFVIIFIVVVLMRGGVTLLRKYYKLAIPHVVQEKYSIIMPKPIQRSVPLVFGVFVTSLLGGSFGVAALIFTPREITQPILTWLATLIVSVTFFETLLFGAQKDRFDLKHIFIKNLSSFIFGAEIFILFIPKDDYGGFSWIIVALALAVVLFLFGLFFSFLLKYFQYPAIRKTVVLSHALAPAGAFLFAFLFGMIPVL